MSMSLCWKSMLFVHTACSCPHVQVESMRHAMSLCSSSKLHVHAANPCCIPMLHVHATCPASWSCLHAARTCCVNINLNIKFNIQFFMQNILFPMSTRGKKIKLKMKTNKTKTNLVKNYFFSNFLKRCNCSSFHRHFCEFTFFVILQNCFFTLENFLKSMD
jgi:hypothetical protein